MMRFLFAFILLVHGLIHLLGYAKAFKLAEVSQLAQPISKPAGAFWLLSAVLFVAATALFLLKKDVWWMPAVLAVLLSQVLIFTSWHDARFGTIANVIALAVILVAYGDWQFKRMVDGELKSFLAGKSADNALLTREKIATLPVAVQQWLERSKAVGKPVVHTVHLKQTGEMRTTPDGKWMPVTAEQYFNADQPGFIWIADLQMAPLIHMAARDQYVGGKGHMLVKALSLFPVADATGKETDQGSMLRYLAEITWFPSAAFNPCIVWEGIDAHSAKATMTNGGISASGIFRFTNDGDILSFEADRYYNRKEGATLEKWYIENKKYGEVGEFRIPVASEVTWKLKPGDFTWFKLQITEVEYNR